MLTKENISKHLNESIHVSVFETLESTNKTAREMTSDGQEQLIIARSQTGGRGRLGRSFFSPCGGLYMSFLLYPEAKNADVTLITAAAAVAVSRAIDCVADVKCQIKWVNDIYLDSKKVCGILTEGLISSDGDFNYLILGIGINITAPPDGFPSEIVNRAGAVFESLADDADNKLAAAVVNEFMTIYRSGLKKKDFLNEYRSRSCVIGRTVNVMRIAGGEALTAEAIGIDDDCRLTVRYDDGTIESLGSGEVTIKGI